MIKKTISIISILLIVLGCQQETRPVNMIAETKPNDLIHETSPYLLQHAYNPVDWKAWNNESLSLAKEQNKLIIISVGYSACHWCHVMEEESFQNDSVAKLMNENFISIKVDREERPDVDQIYMNAVQLMTGSGGWPLNCITLPDGRPVFGGTYFSKAQWIKILDDMSSLYRDNPEKVVAFAEKLTEGIQNSELITVSKEVIPFKKEEIASLVLNLKETLDFNQGGQKNAPKFPMPSNLSFLLRYSFQNNDRQLQQYVFTSLHKMASGGIYDQIGGGFSRYSVDNKWHVPHFEKMLYDNAQLVSLYSEAYQLTKDESFKTIIEETLAFVERELLQKEGAFYSSIDADSKNANNELEEGAYYVWNKTELEEILKEDFNLFKEYYNINNTGKWEDGKYILYKTKSDKEFSETNTIDLKDLQAKVSYWKALLNTARSSRKSPRTDDKVLTSWNALMLNAYVDAYKALGNKSYLITAVNCAEFIQKYQVKSNGSLNHSYKDAKSTIEGFSEDYAHTISAFIGLYQVTLNDVWLDNAKTLMDYTMAHFLNKETSMFYFTTDNAPNLISRKTEVVDNVIPSSNSVLAEGLFKLGHYYSDKAYAILAKQMLSNISSDMVKAPSGYTNWLNLYLNYSNPYYEVAISGPDAEEKLKEINTAFLPNILTLASNKDSEMPLLKNKYNDDETLIYVCVNGTCKLPVADVSDAINQILK